MNNPLPTFVNLDDVFWELINFDDHWSNEGIYLMADECKKHGLSKALYFPWDSGCGHTKICIKCLEEIITLANQTSGVTEA